mmetsp:Transcript_1547/g.2045  ORF Transcript_1547/g.2045 Transcript_1547/m.2045 type:complete len:160 (+) Transcript_1547:88-567(+)
MEFGTIGKHCADPSCKQLDFLPFTCDGCQKVFCLDHRTYKDHKCPNANFKDTKVTTCPLCEQPVNILKSQNPDQVMDEHIRNGCKPIQKERIMKNKCSVKKCKQSELIPIQCKDCRQQFCVRHRNAFDHECPALKANNNNANRAPLTSKSRLLTPIKAH